MIACTGRYCAVHDKPRLPRKSYTESKEFVPRYSHAPSPSLASATLLACPDSFYLSKMIKNSNNNKTISFKSYNNFLYTLLPHSIRQIKII